MPARPRPRGILLTGSVGSGKTRLPRELGELLEEREEPYALVDLDLLARGARPPALLSRFKNSGRAVVLGFLSRVAAYGIWRRARPRYR